MDISGRTGNEYDNGFICLDVDMLCSVYNAVSSDHRTRPVMECPCELPSKDTIYDRGTLGIR